MPVTRTRRGAHRATATVHLPTGGMGEGLGGNGSGGGTGLGGVGGAGGVGVGVGLLVTIQANVMSSEVETSLILFGF
jgi:hypothetical protein